MHVSIRLLSVCLAAVVLIASAQAEPDANTSKEAAKNDKAKPSAGTIPDATGEPIRTTNSVTIAGERVTYAAEAGMLPLLKPDGTSQASIFYVAYLRQGESDVARRPVTFCFNGGPGSASLWLHLGALGPRRVRMNEDGTLPSPPFGITDNEYSILHATDLVFIDPVATGYSRASEEDKTGQFFGQSPDIESVGEFIRLWTSRHERWLSPKYLCGESYGVFRAAELASHLQSRYGMYLNGLVLVSGVLDYGVLQSELASLVFLPSYTATAHFHKKLPPDLQADLPKALAESRATMKGEYASALFQGAALSDDQRARIVAKLARLTGLAPRVIEDHDLRIDSLTFRKELLRDRRLILGRYDARLTGRDSNPAATAPEFDPSATAVAGPFAAAINAYLRGELKFDNDLPYELVSRRASQEWDFASRNRYPNTADQLATVVEQNPYLRVLVLSGQYDLACPIDSMRYSIDHIRLDPAYRGNITYTEYQAGHMMYINLPDLKKLQKDLETFLQK